MHDDFATTQWSLVLAAGRPAASDSREALSRLCQAYWLPLYLYVRRRIAGPEEAQDLTQSFFVHLLENDVLSVAQPQRGRFRAFLLTSLKHFLATEWEKNRAQKRGGGRQILSLDFAVGESQFAAEPSHSLTPERVFERQWALLLLKRVLERLREEQTKAGKARQFDLLKGWLTGDGGDASYATIASELAVSEGAVKVASHRLRKRYRALLRAEIAETVADPAEVDDELRSLFDALQG